MMNPKTKQILLAVAVSTLASALFEFVVKPKLTKIIKGSK